MAKINPVSTVTGQDLAGRVREGSTASKSGLGSALLRFAEVQTAVQMKNKASEDFLKGQQAIAQGTSLADIKKNQPVYTKFFGENATVQGARALQTDQALDTAFRNAVDAIPDNAHMLPKDYAVAQQEQLAGYLDGMEDDQVRAQVTVAFSKKAADLAALQTKAHAKFVDQDMRSKYLSSLYSKSDNVQSSYARDGELYRDSNQELIAAMQRPKGMNAETHKGIMVETVVTSLQGGNGAMYQNLVSSDLFDQLEPPQRASIFKAYDSYTASQRKEMALESGKSLSGITQYVTTPEATVDGLTNQLAEHKDRFGLSSAKAESLFNAFATKKNKIDDDKDYTSLAREGNFHLIPEKQQKESLSKLRDELGPSYPEYWGSIGVNDKFLSDKWTQSANVMVLPDGSVDGNFVEVFQEFTQFANINEAKAFDHITSKEGKARMQAVLSRYQASGDLETAIRGRASVEQANNENIFTAEVNGDIANEVETATTDGWGWFVPVKGDNRGYIRSEVTRRAKDYMTTGKLNAEDAVAIATLDFQNTTETIKGNVVPHGGKPLTKQLGLKDGETVDGILDDFVEDNRIAMFGDHLGDYDVQRSANSNVLSLTPINENGLPLAGSFNLDIKALSDARTLESANQQDRELQAAASQREVDIEHKIANYQRHYKRAYGKTISHDKALDLMNDLGRRETQMRTDAVVTGVEVLPKLESFGLGRKTIEDAMRPRKSVGSRAVEKANVELSKKGLAHVSGVGMGWGVESVKAVGEANGNIGKMLDIFAGVESNYGKNLANPTSSARGMFQYMTKGLSGGNNAMQTSTTRAIRYAKSQGAVPKWLESLHTTAMKGSDEDRAQAMTMLSADQSAALMLLEMNSRPKTKELLDRVKGGDKQAAWILYSVYHHTSPDAATIKLYDKVSSQTWKD